MLPPAVNVEDEMSCRDVVEKEEEEGGEKAVWGGEEGWDMGLESTQNVVDLDQEKMEEEGGRVEEPSSVAETQLKV